jgi:hypothetical protein
MHLNLVWILAYCSLALALLEVIKRPRRRLRLVVSNPT